MNNLVLLETAVTAIQEKLFATAPLEDGVFCLLYEGKTEVGSRLLVTEVIMPPEDGWECQERDQLRPSAQWLSAVIGTAIEKKAGLLFIHSHPDSRYPPSLSPIDLASFKQLATTIAPMLEGPFAAAVVHPVGWAGVLWKNGAVISLDRITSIGRILLPLNPLIEPQNSTLDLRQRTALGKTHHMVRQSTVAIVGTGGLGSPMAEQLVRMGVSKLILLDPDTLDTPSNVRRVFGSKLTDINNKKPELKVEIVGRYLEGLGLEVEIETIAKDVRREEAFRKLLQADVVLNGTDTHASRAVVNELASTYLLPVIDVGVRVGVRNDQILSNLTAEIRILTPVTPCLWCRGSISGAKIREENLPQKQREQLMQEGYIVGSVGMPEPSVVALTVLGSSLATCALLALFSEDGQFVSSGYVWDGFLGDAFSTQPTVPISNCRCRKNLGLGDLAAPTFI